MKGPQDLTATAILKATAPAWYWLRENFSLPAVLTIAGIVAAAGGYIITLRTRVVVLETEVVHITKIVPDSSMLATLRTKVDDHEQRITRLEGDFDYARRCPPHCDADTTDSRARTHERVQAPRP